MNILLDDVSMSYRTKNRAPRTVFSHFNLRIDPGEVVGIIGPEGAGKSTLLQLIDGLHQPERGHIIVGGTDLWATRSAAREARRKIAYALQFPEQQFFCETVVGELEFKRKNIGTTVDEELQDILRRVGLDPEALRDRSPFSLSMGEARRVALASVLIGGPELLLLDEPSAGLDGAGTRAILSVIAQEFAGRTTLIVSHDVDVLSDCVDRIIVVDNGVVAADAPVGSLFTDRMRIEALGYHLPEGMQIMEELRLAGAAVGPGFYRNSAVENMLRGDPSLRRLLQQ
jgi:energy-coupling factor transport system ATP-binding protein